MERIQINLYKFHELSEESKEKALEDLCYINVDHDWWEFAFDDAERIGLQITEFDLGNRKIDGRLKWSMQESCEAILENHGEICDTYILAKSYMDQITELSSIEDEDEYEDAIDDLTAEFEYELLQEYLTILDKEYEWQTSEEPIIDLIEANNYDFTEDGKLY